MSTQLVQVTQLPLNEIMSVGKAFAESGMFTDIKSAAQAIVKIQAGQEIGIPPFAAMTGIHIIQGKPAIGAGLMAARVKGSGKYDYEVKEQTEKICSIDFYQGKKLIGNSTFTEADAKKAGTKNMDKFPKNMLFARAISNGIKWFAPDVFSGPVYTPEELGSGIVTEDITAEVIEDRNLALSGAIADVYTAPDLKALKAVWTSHKEFHKDAAFVAATNEQKTKLKPTDQELLNTPADPLEVHK